MGPDCGTAIIGGVPLGFANAVPRGDIGIVGASGTGIQEVSCLIANAGRGISHAIGTGGRDLSAEVGGITTLTAIDLLDRDPATRHVVLISKPPAPEVAELVLARVGRSRKPFTVCLIGGDRRRRAAGQREACGHADGGGRELCWGASSTPTGAALPKRGRRPADPRPLLRRHLVLGGAADPAAARGRRSRRMRRSPARRGSARSRDAHTLIDLGDDAVHARAPAPDDRAGDARCAAARRRWRTRRWASSCSTSSWDGASTPIRRAQLVRALGGRPADGPAIIASVTGTEADPQVRSAQVRKLADAGVIVAPSNAAAAALAMQCIAMTSISIVWGRMPSALSSAMRRARGGRVRAQPASRGGRRLPLHRRCEHRPRSAQCDRLDSQAWTRLAARSAAGRQRAAHRRSAQRSHRRSGASTRRAPSSGVPRPGRRLPDGERVACRRCDALQRLAARAGSGRRHCADRAGHRLASRTRRLSASPGRASSRLRAWLDARRFGPRTTPRPSICWGSVPASRRRATIFCGAARGAARGRTRPTRLASSTPGIAKAAPAATSPLSGAFLRAAAEGLGCRALHAAIAAASRGRAEALAGRSRPWAASATPRAGTRSPAPCSSCRHSAQLRATRRSRTGPDFRVSSIPMVRTALPRARGARPVGVRRPAAQRIWGSQMMNEHSKWRALGRRRRARRWRSRLPRRCTRRRRRRRSRSATWRPCRAPPPSRARRSRAGSPSPSTRSTPRAACSAAASSS